MSDGLSRRSFLGWAGGVWAMGMKAIPWATDPDTLPPAGSGSIDLAPSSDPRYQGRVRFNCEIPAVLDNPRIWLAAYQDVNFPGIDEEEVYGEGGRPGSSFELGGDVSLWAMRGGGPAHCSARLYYIPNAKGTAEWTGRGVQGPFVYLAYMEFEAAGAAVADYAGASR